MRCYVLCEKHRQLIHTASPNPAGNVSDVKDLPENDVSDGEGCETNEVLPKQMVALTEVEYGAE